MKLNEEIIKEMVYTSPLTLLAVTDKEIIEEVNKYLPYSVGLEFECYKKPVYDIEDFRNIPHIMDVNVDSSEQRYRIPSGINGLLCLYCISFQLRLNTVLNLGSSVHIHTDLVEVWKNMSFLNRSMSDGDWIIEELKTWGTALDLSNAHRGSWYKFNDLKTIEIRIGEPSFDYTTLVTRIIQASNINTRIRYELGYGKSKIKVGDFNPNVFIEYLLQYTASKKIEKTASKYIKEDDSKTQDINLDEAKNIIRNRVNRI